MKTTIFWTAPMIWPDSTVFILGGGPSLRNCDLSPIHNKHVIGVNNSYKLGDWVDVCWWGDSGWFDTNRKELDEFAGLKVHCSNRHQTRPGTKRLLRGKPLGIDIRPTHVSWNNNSGASAINLAVLFGAKRVVLLGFDMKFGPNGENNWHADYPEKGKKWNPYPKFLQCFPHIQRDAQRLGVEILNASPDSALTVFPMARLEDVV